MIALLIRECEDCDGFLAFSFDGEKVTFLPGSKPGLDWMGLASCECAVTPARIAALEAEIEEEERADAEG